MPCSDRLSLPRAAADSLLYFFRYINKRINGICLESGPTKKGNRDKNDGKFVWVWRNSSPARGIHRWNWTATSGVLEEGCQGIARKAASGE